MIRPSRSGGALALALALLAAAALAAGCGGGKKVEPAPGVAGASQPHVWKPGVPDTLGPVVAIVGERRIRAHEIDSLIETAPPNLRAQLHEAEGYKNLVNRVVTEEVVYQAAKRSGLENDPAYQAAAAKAAREALMRIYYQRRSAAFPQPADSAVQAFYVSHQSSYQIPTRARLRHIQVSTRARADALRKRLAAGGLWDALARSDSEDKTTRDNGGVLGFVTPGSDYIPAIGNAPEIVKAAFELKEGETSRPLKSAKGWHLIRVDHVDPARVQPLSEVRQGIVGHLAQDSEEAHSQALLDSLRTAANATVFEDSIRAALVPNRTPQDFFKDAQAAALPEQRIDLYRQVVARYPDDPVSIQAQFMIGFTYAEDLAKYDEARAEFQKFIAKYPKSELANSARWMLENMDKPAPELKDAPEGTGGTGAAPDSLR
ncbi:MAG TPA: peptidyl-prolyl cis-trans isomerase [Candidatus Limnocylindrales bacterium]|nr:peptidyl-prolyl cis-trans isomerase [Candidatus Limnocylindrales bacterium]